MTIEDSFKFGNLAIEPGFYAIKRALIAWLQDLPHLYVTMACPGLK